MPAMARRPAQHPRGRVRPAGTGTCPTGPRAPAGPHHIPWDSVSVPKPRQRPCRGWHHIPHAGRGAGRAGHGEETENLFQDANQGRSARGCGGTATPGTAAPAAAMANGAALEVFAQRSRAGCSLGLLGLGPGIPWDLELLRRLLPAHPAHSCPTPGSSCQATCQCPCPTCGSAGTHPQPFERRAAVAKGPAPSPFIPRSPGIFPARLPAARTRSDTAASLPAASSGDARRCRSLSRP